MISHVNEIYALYTTLQTEKCSPAVEALLLVSGTLLCFLASRVCNGCERNISREPLLGSDDVEDAQ